MKKNQTIAKKGMNFSFINSILSKTRNLCFSRSIKNKGYLEILNELDYEIKNVIPVIDNNKSIKILFGPSFCIYPPCFIHDRLLSYALRLRGVKIIPFYCDGIQSVECDFFGGVWMNGEFIDNCKNCIQKSEDLWQKNPVPPIKLSKYISLEDKESVKRIVDQLHGDEWVSFEYDDMPFGMWAKDILVNNYVVGDYHLIENNYSLGKNHLSNLLLLHIAYNKLLSEIQPDRVISHDSFYGMMAILQELCKRKKIPFYSHWPGNRIGTWCYAYNDAAMNLDFSEPWIKFTSNDLNSHQMKIVQDWIDGRQYGKGMILDTASVKEYQQEIFDLSGFSFDKPTALLSSNVVWDMAALNKQIIFSDMMEWIVETIHWFKNHPEFQLIIKPHPGEENPLIPITKERVGEVIKKNFIEIPANVVVLSPKTNVTLYQFFQHIDLGLVHTSTAGLEMAASQIPVITTGKSTYRGFGFTFDPSSKEEYYEKLNDLLTNRLKIDKQQKKLAYQFIYFYQHIYFINTNLIEFKWQEEPHIKISHISDLMPSKNFHLDYVINSIIDGEPILSKDRWPPDSS